VKTPLSKVLKTPSGSIPLPAYIPVTTFGKKYPLDGLIGPYLARLAKAVMVSWHYAKQMEERPRLPLLVDSGGFAALFEGNRVVKQGKLGILYVRQEDGEKTEAIHPRDVLDFQEKVADVAFTLDFPIPPNLDKNEAELRKRLTIANALWAADNQRRKDMLLYGCIQAWDAASAREVAIAYSEASFDGVAIGGLVPRSRNRELLESIVRSVREVLPDIPLHAFGLGNPDLTDWLFQIGVDSVDSSSYVKMAAEGKLWGRPDVRIDEPSPTDRLHLALCNLATATKAMLPLSASRIVFSTPAIETAANRLKPSSR
jgi:queuine/archaeosine tRNA-ribosyltransferase